MKGHVKDASQTVKLASQSNIVPYVMMDIFMKSRPKCASIFKNKEEHT